MFPPLRLEPALFYGLPLPFSLPYLLSLSHTILKVLFSEHCRCAFQVRSPTPIQNLPPKSTSALLRCARPHFFLFHFLLLSLGEFNLSDAWRLVISISPSLWCAFIHVFPQQPVHPHFPSLMNSGLNILNSSFFCSFLCCSMVLLNIFSVLCGGGGFCMWCSQPHARRAR